MEAVKSSVDGLVESMMNSLDAKAVHADPETGQNDRVAPRMKRVNMELENYKRQAAYVAVRKAMGGLPTLVTPDAFIRGMRDLGYKDPAWALAELIDNSVQGNARCVEIRFGFDAQNASHAKNPSQIAIIDDGVGIQADMLTYAVEWGGTDRENDRTGFGRYGYGLPSSCVSAACRYTVYSKVEGGDWNAVTVDIAEIVKAGNDAQTIAGLMAPQPRPLPKWLGETPAKGIDASSLKSGTVIILEDLDRLRKMTGWTLVKALGDKLKKRFGLIYRHWLTDVKIIVDGAEVEAIDPLFLLDYARFVDETPVRAKQTMVHAFEVTTADGQKGNVRIRAALLPPKFSWATPDDPSSERNKNQRWKQALLPKEQLNGLLICREGRQIDVVQPEWTKFQNLDTYVKIEIDFDPILDEFFNITTAKQQIRIDEGMWDKLKAPVPGGGGLKDLVQDMRAEFAEYNDEIKAWEDNAKKDKLSELPAATAMQQAERFRVKTPRLSDKAREAAQKNLDEAVVAEAEATKITVQEARDKLQEAVKKRPWDIDFQAINEGPFFIPKRLGAQKRIILNTAHAFYTRLYEPASPEVRSALEVLLFILADGEINADDERASFYKNERLYQWSPMLQHALTALVHQTQVEDSTSMRMEKAEMEAETR
jgi:hypothetical protein